MSTTTARHRATGHAAGRPVARRATKASALALAVTIPFGALTAAPAHATMLGTFTTDPQFDGTVMRHNAIVNLIFSMVPSQDTLPGDSTEHYLSPGYAPSWEGALKIFTTDGKHHIATIRKIDSDSFRITWEEAIRSLSNPTANVTLPIGYEYSGDLINGLKPNAYNPLLVDGKETGASFYFTKLRQLSNGAVLYAYTQLETGKVRLGPVAQVARWTPTATSPRRSSPTGTGPRTAPTRSSSSGPTTTSPTAAGTGPTWPPPRSSSRALPTSSWCGSLTSRPACS